MSFLDRLVGFLLGAGATVLFIVGFGSYVIKRDKSKSIQSTLYRVTYYPSNAPAEHWDGVSLVNSSGDTLSFRDEVGDVTVVSGDFKLTKYHVPMPDPLSAEESSSVFKVSDAKQ